VAELTREKDKFERRFAQVQSELEESKRRMEAVREELRAAQEAAAQAEAKAAAAEAQSMATRAELEAKRREAAKSKGPDAAPAPSEPAGPGRAEFTALQLELDEERERREALEQRVEQLLAELAEKPVERIVEKVVEKEKIVVRENVIQVQDDPNSPMRPPPGEQPTGVSQDELDEAVHKVRQAAAVREAVLQAEIDRLTAALAELQAKFRDVLGNLDVGGANKLAMLRQLKAAGLDVAGLAVGGRRVFERLYQDALDRIERLHVLRERALAERAEEMHLILAREEVFMREIEGLLPLRPGLVQDPEMPPRPVRSAKRLPNPWVERAANRRSRSSSPDDTPTRPQTAAGSGYAIVGMLDWWMDAHSRPLTAGQRERRPRVVGDDLPHREALQERTWPRPSSLTDLRKSAGTALDLDPSRAWLRPSSSALPLVPRLEPMKPQDFPKKKEKT